MKLFHVITGNISNSFIGHCDSGYWNGQKSHGTCPPYISSQPCRLGPLFHFFADRHLDKNGQKNSCLSFTEVFFEIPILLSKNKLPLCFCDLAVGAFLI